MKRPEKSIIIIGAGIAGLSAGCYGRMNGYRTHIFEMHHRPGGLCTSWQNRGYTIDGCLHWLVGSSPASNFYRIWQELGAVQGRRMIYHEEFMRIEGRDGKSFIFYTDLDRLEQHMKDLAPGDRDVIEDFSRGLRIFAKYDMPIDKPPELYSLLDLLKLLSTRLPLMRAFMKWKNVSLADFAARFRDPFLRETFPLFWDVPDFSMAFMLMNLAWLHNRSAGYPIGGSLEFSKAIERRYLDLGGEIRYRAPVQKILVENGRATGVRLADDSEHRADYVISAADGHSTIFDMLEGKYVSEKIRTCYEKNPTFQPLVQVALGIARPFDETPPLAAGTSFPLEQPVVLAEKEHRRLPLHIYNFDDTLAPPGKTIVKVMFESDYQYWKKLGESPEHYRAEKERLADTVVALLDRRFPGLAAQVEMRDVATPLTYERYTGNWKGSYEGWLPTTKALFMNMSKTLPGLGSFYMAGQWVEPGGGVPTAAMSGRNVIQIICRKDKKRFVTTVP
ncbi:MAG: amine oxidase [Dehalococcoidia bacterium]|nr:amine oxidase [Dehalococcoidia bacterium]